MFFAKIWKWSSVEALMTETPISEISYKENDDDDAALLAPNLFYQAP